jgi:FkbM family methyltransferase
MNKIYKLLKKLIKNCLKKLNLKILLKEDYLNINIQTLKQSFSENLYSNTSVSIESLLNHFSKNYKNSYGQLMQDLFVDYILNKDNGFFVEVGACDGLAESNTFWLEKNRNWNGILCEPAEFWHEELLKNRPNCIIEKKPIFIESQKFVNFYLEKGSRSYVGNNNKKKREPGEIEDGPFRGYKGPGNFFSLESISLNQLFLKHSVDRIDYLSIDTEGSEFDILNDLDFTKFKPSIITIEHAHEKLKRKKIFSLLKNNNYSRVFKSITRFDDWYINNDLLNK